MGPVLFLLYLALSVKGLSISHDAYYLERRPDLLGMILMTLTVPGQLVLISGIVAALLLGMGFAYFSNVVFWK